jgi:hypothetical protein
LLLSLPASATTRLDYDAFVAGTKVGGAAVTIEKNADDSYAIEGKAWTTGFLKFVTKWRSAFSASGSLEDGVPVAQEYGFIEKARNKIKQIFLREGEVHYVKNGEQRTPGVDPAHTDLLSALFMPEGCSPYSAVHNGNDYFRLTLTAEIADAGNMRCEYQVLDKDDESTQATIWLGEVNGLLVPTRMDLEGALEGTLRLKS